MKPNELQMSYMKQAAPSNHSDSIHRTLQNNPPDIQSGNISAMQKIDSVCHERISESYFRA